jgi:hypothetical protein
MKSGGSSHGSLFIVICDEKGDGLTLCEQTPISSCVHPLSCTVQKLCTYLHPSSGDDEINHHESLSSANIHDKDDGLTLCEQLS